MGQLTTTLRPASLESRSDPRVGAEIAVDLVSDQFSGGLRAVTRDLSVGGVCVATRSPFAHTSLRQIVLHLPGGPLRLAAEGRWQRWNRTTGAILTGIAFRDLSTALQDVLWDHVLDVSKELARFLFRHSEVSDIGIDGAMSLAQSSRLLVVGAGEFVYQQGGEYKDAPSSIFMLREGGVVLRTRLRGSIERDFAAVRPGDFFGGLPMLAAVEHYESAVARAPSRLVEIDERAYSYLMQARPWVAQKLAFTVTRAYARRMHAMLEGLGSPEPAGAPSLALAPRRIAHTE